MKHYMNFEGYLMLAITPYTHYHIYIHNNIEIISLNSFQENHGIGTKLLNTVDINI